MTQKIKVSKIGNDVLTTDNSNLSFSSDLATHAIYSVVDIVKPPGTTSVTYSHNLGYIPKMWIFFEGSDGGSVTYARIPYFDVDLYDIDYYVGTADITIEVDSVGTAAGSASIDFRAVIFTRSPNP